MAKNWQADRRRSGAWDRPDGAHSFRIKAPPFPVGRRQTWGWAGSDWAAVVAACALVSFSADGCPSVTNFEKCASRGDAILIMERQIGGL